MSRYLPVILTASLALGFSACQTPQTTTVKSTETHSVNQTGRKPMDQMPAPTPKPTVETNTTMENTPSNHVVEPAVTPMPTPVVQDYPTAKAVEAKPGFVLSPGGSGIVDVRGYPPGTEVKDPYTGKVFLVP